MKCSILVYIVSRVRPQLGGVRGGCGDLSVFPLYLRQLLGTGCILAPYEIFFQLVISNWSVDIQNSSIVVCDICTMCVIKKSH